MQVKLLHDPPLASSLPLVAFAVFEGDEPLDGPSAQADEILDGDFSRARAAGDFRGREEEFALFYSDDVEGGIPRRILFLGAGPRGDADAETMRKLAARAVRRAEALHMTRVAVQVPLAVLDDLELAVQASAEGGALAAWDFRELKSDSEDPTGERSVGALRGTSPPASPLVEELVLCVTGDRELAERGLRTGRAFAAGENLARTLQCRPGNVATPEHLAEVAQSLADDYGFDATILGPAELEAEAMGAILAVTAGSTQEPRLIVLEHRGGREGDPPIALVGKGLTFDTGGISIKPASGMEDMKYDMSGGAAVLGAMRAIGELRTPANVVAVVPASENLISGRATKPGDIIRTRAGKTVEVINTDAEGRLILADALSYVVDRYHPRAIVDCATLTGACVVALGSHAAAVLGNDEELIDELRAAGDRAAERCWPLPLWKVYRKQLESEAADLKNVGGRPAGTVTAACFLSEFVGDSNWAHLDIAGTAYGEPRAPYHRKGGHGFPTRLLLEWVRDRAG